MLSLIVAASENNVIGKDNGLIWHLSADLKRFKALTTGHSIIMGRKTFESIGKPLPNRRNIIISASLSIPVTGCEIVPSIDAALELVQREEEAFVIGGGSVYRALWEKADRLYLTRIQTNVEGDTFIPEIQSSDWKETLRQEFPADEKNEFNYSFINYVRLR